MAKQPSKTDPIVDPPVSNNPVKPVVSFENDPVIQAANGRFNDILSGMDQRIYEKSKNPYAAATPYSFDIKSTTNPNKNLEHFKTHAYYDKLGFNPWRDNETIYNEKGSGWADIKRAGIASMKLAKSAFMSPIHSYGDLLAGKPLAPDYEGGEAMSYYNTVGGSSRGGVAGFTANLVSNSGYTLGLIGEMALETVLLGALSTGTGGVGAGAAVARSGRYAKQFGKIKESIDGLMKTMSTLKDYGVVKGSWEVAKRTGKFINPLENVTNAVYGMATGAKVYEGLSALAKASKTAGAFYRDLRWANLTLAEAKMEGAMTEIDLERELIQKFKEDNFGREPSLFELTNIKQAATDAGAKTLAWNIPTIYLTNKLTFEPLMRSFGKPSEYVMRNGLKFMEVEGKGLVEATFKRKLIASLKPKNFHKAPLKYFGANFAEGIQESAQEVVSGVSKDYARSIYNTDVKRGTDYGQGESYSFGVIDGLAKNVTDQFSGHGFETFASGFFMGGLVGPVRSAIDRVTNIEGKEYRQRKKQYAQETLKTLNEIYKDPLKYFGTNIVNFSQTAEAVKGQAQAEEAGDKKAWMDFENENVVNHVTTALETGTYDIFLDKLNDIKKMDPQGIKEAFGLEADQVLPKIDSVIRRAERIKDNYEKWNTRYENPFDPGRYKKDSSEYTAEAIGYATWERAKKTAVFNEVSFERNLKRIESITNDMISQGLKGVLASDVTMLLDPNAVRRELSVLSGEIEVMEASEVAETRKKAKIKKQRAAKLEKFLENLQGYYLGSNEEIMKVAGDKVKRAHVGQLYKAFQSYVNHLAETQAGQIDEFEVRGAFQQILDVHELGQDNVYYAEAVRVMTDPQGFVNQFRALEETMKDLYKNREQLVKDSVDFTQTKIEDNAILGVLADRGFVISPENIDAFLKNKEIPSEFYDTNAKKVVRPGDPRYEEFKKIVENYVEGTKPETAPIETPAATQPNPPAPVSEKADTAQSEVGKAKQSENTSSRPPLDINLVKKFDAVKTGAQLEALEKELITLMGQTTVEERIKAGITSANIDQQVKVKTKELTESLTFENVQVGNVLSLKGAKEKEANVVVVQKTASTISYRPVGDASTKTMVKKENFGNLFKFKYSDKMEKPSVKSTPQEAATAKQNTTQNENFLSNNKEVLAETMKDAFEREAEFIQEFENELGCK